MKSTNRLVPLVPQATLLALGLLSLTSAGCLPTAGTRPPSYEPAAINRGPTGSVRDGPYERFFFETCAEITGDELHTRAFTAMLMALEANAWTITELNFRQKYIEASACVNADPERCATLNFQAKLSGQLSASYHKSFTQRSLEDDIAEWIAELRQVYADFSCYSDEQLAEVLERYGFEF
jgi:hypothetical protein